MENTIKRFAVEILTVEEALSLIEACSAKSSIGLRNRALLTVLYRTGFRLAEALALKVKDHAGGTLTALHGKGDKTHVVGIDAGTEDVLRRWLERKETLGLSGHQHLFCTLAGEPIKTPYVCLLMHRLATKAGIEKRVDARGLRHTHEAELARESNSATHRSVSA